MQLRVGRLIRALTGLVRFGRLIGIHKSAHVSVQGTFAFGKRVSIGRNSVIQVRHDTTLKLGNWIYLGREVEITPDREISIGDFTSVQDRCTFLGQVRVGANCVFAPNVFISSGTHQFRVRPAWLIRDQDALVTDPSHAATYPRHMPVQIQDDCWIGINVVVMRGVTIGRGSVVGANSVVTKSIEPYSVAAGSPARVINRRLVFAPPRTIVSNDPDHLPYFYSGFDLRQSVISSAVSGLRAHGRFQLALDRSNASAVYLEIDADKPITLSCFDQRQTLAIGTQRVSFKLTDTAAGFIEMEARDIQGSDCAVAIRRASTES